MASCTSINFDASHHAVVVLLVLGASLVSLIARSHLLELQKQGATTDYCSSKVCLLFCLGPDLCSKFPAQEWPPATLVKNGPKEKLLLIWPRSQPVDKGCGSALDKL